MEYLHDTNTANVKTSQEVEAGRCDAKAVVGSVSEIGGVRTTVIAMTHVVGAPTGAAVHTHRFPVVCACACGVLATHQVRRRRSSNWLAWQDCKRDTWTNHGK